MNSMTQVATGLSHGNRPLAEHAAQAVQQALEKAGMVRANNVLLFLTPEYASDPEPALRAAARTAGTMQVMGCTGVGLLTDQEWLLDSAGAAAMVFGGKLGIDLFNPKNDTEGTVLSLSTPSGLTADWMDVPATRLGAISGDLYGQGPFTVWDHCRIDEGGSVDGIFRGIDSVISVSQGVRALTSPIEVAEVNELDILRMGNYPALNVLVQSLPNDVKDMKQIPLHLIMGGVTFGDPETAIRDGRYRLNHIVSANLKNRSITLSSPLNAGERMFWAMRDALAAERDMRDTIRLARQRLGRGPDFALLFPCMGRGPHFFGNRDRDLEVLKDQFPGLPIIGFYGNGEIGPLDEANNLFQYSAVFGLFAQQEK